MPSGPRIRANNVFGITTDNPLSAVATSFNSASLFLLPVVSSAHAIIVLDPKRVNGEPEIVVVTAHTALATSATISRAAYGTTARSHPVGTQWAHVVVTDDVVPIVTSSTRPSDPYEGQYIYETDTHRPAHRDNTQWLPGGPVSVVTSGTRPANPYEGQTIYETDTHRPVVRDNTQWLPGGPVSVVTSGTRPANPYEGQMIYETDTDFNRTWNGSAWAMVEQVRIPNANGPLVGSNANITSATFLQMGTNVVSSSLGGDFTITFQSAYPNALLAFFIIQGDTTHPGASFIPFLGGAALSSQVVRMYHADGSLWTSSGNLRVTWLAIGW